MSCILLGNLKHEVPIPVPTIKPIARSALRFLTRRVSLQEQWRLCGPGSVAIRCAQGFELHATYCRRNMQRQVVPYTSLNLALFLKVLANFVFHVCTHSCLPTQVHISYHPTLFEPYLKVHTAEPSHRLVAKMPPTTTATANTVHDLTALREQIQSKQAP